MGGKKKKKPGERGGSACLASSVEGNQVDVVGVEFSLHLMSTKEKKRAQKSSGVLGCLLERWVSLKQRSDSLIHLIWCRGGKKIGGKLLGPSQPWKEQQKNVFQKGAGAVTNFNPRKKRRTFHCSCSRMKDGGRGRK